MRSKKFILFFIIIASFDNINAQDGSGYNFELVNENSHLLMNSPQIMDSADGEYYLGYKIEELGFYNDTTYDNPHKTDTVHYYIRVKDKIKIEVKKLYKNKELFEITSFNDKGLNGVSKTLYLNGQIQSLSYYNDGKLISPIITWFCSGHIAGIESYMGRIIHHKHYHPNDIIYNEYIGLNEQSKSAYWSRIYNDEGVLVLDAQYNSGIGHYREYFDNGKINVNGNILNIEINKVGKWEMWGVDGKLKSTQQFHDSIPNLPIGTWKYYNEQGKLIKEEIYEAGELIGTKEYTPLNFKKD